MHIVFERRVNIAQRSLRGREQRELSSAIHRLQNLTSDEIRNNTKIHMLRSESNNILYAYLLSDRLRLVFSIQGDSCCLVDVVDSSRLSLMSPGEYSG